MARVVNEEEYANKRNEILDVVQSLIYTKGYEQMTIQDILDSLQISKGAFYHYFDSKQALLGALLDRIVEQMQQMLTPIVDDEDLPALEKFQHFFSSIARWKTARRGFLMGLLKVWMTDDNAIVRQAMRITVSNPVAAMLTTVIHQGIQEGALNPAYPEQAARVAFGLMQDLGDSVGRALLEFDPETDDPKAIEDLVAAYTAAIENVLGVPAGSLPLFDNQILRMWFLPEDEPQAMQEA